MKAFTGTDFVRESNRIENIHRDPTSEEMIEYTRFMRLETVSLEEMVRFVSVYQPDAFLRDKIGINVIVGSYSPPPGGHVIPAILMTIMEDANAYKADQEMAYMLHHRYEKLHPFTDGNGRSGRMLWMWMMRKAPLGFLHTFYYQALQFSR